MKLLYLFNNNLLLSDLFLIPFFFFLLLSFASICHSWQAAASFQLWTIRSTTTTCAGSTITYQTFEHTDLNLTLKTYSCQRFLKNLRKWSRKNRARFYVKHLDTDVRLCTISQHVHLCWFMYVAYTSSSFCCILYTCLKTKSDTLLCS